MDWRDYALTALITLFTEEIEMPEENAVKLARTLLDLSEPEFGEELGDDQEELNLNG